MTRSAALLLSYLWFVVSSSLSHPTHHIEDHLRVRPPMGWASWLSVPCADLTEVAVMKAANQLLDNGYFALGYNTVFLDSCWMSESTSGRNASYALRADIQKFPRGLKQLREDLHQRGVKLGVTIGGGEFTCQDRWGSLLHEEADADFLAAAHVDYVRMDNCHTEAKPALTANYRVSQRLRKTNLEAQFISTLPALMTKTSSPAEVPWGDLEVSLDVWTVFEDTRATWEFITDVQTYFLRWRDILAGTPRKGKYIWWGLLVGGTGSITSSEARSQMTLWALLGAPLIIGGPLDDTQDSEHIYKNPAVVAIAQDMKPRPAALITVSQGCTMWGRELYDGTGVVGVINNGTDTITQLEITWAGSRDKWRITELWYSKDEGIQEACFVWRGVLEASDALLFHFRLANSDKLGEKKRPFTVNDFRVGHPSEFTQECVESSDSTPSRSEKSQSAVKHLRDAKSVE